MFGSRVRQLREGKKRDDRTFSVRQVGRRIGVEPAYLSKVERGMVAPPSEEKIIRLARELGEDPDVLLSLAGKVSSDVLAIIRKRPRALAGLVRSLRSVSERKIAAMAQSGKGGMK
jgi:transcriptional regulator with XRE-family HTH domain